MSLNTKIDPIYTVQQYLQEGEAEIPDGQHKHDHALSAQQPGHTVLENNHWCMLSTKLQL